MHGPSMTSHAFNFVSVPSSPARSVRPRPMIILVSSTWVASETACFFLREKSHMRMACVGRWGRIARLDGRRGHLTCRARRPPFAIPSRFSFSPVLRLPTLPRPPDDPQNGSPVLFRLKANPPGGPHGNRRWQVEPAFLPAWRCVGRQR